jgi:hypothetical protein
MATARFVELPGNTVARLPYFAQDATIHAIFFESEMHILQRVCNRILNDHSDNPLRYHVSYPVVLVTALYANRRTSSDPIDKTKGWVKEADIGLWIAVQGGLASDPNT